MAKINLSIPDDTKTDMDAIHDANWSAVALSAFSTVIARNKFRGNSMQDYKGRLIASKARIDKEMFDSGVDCGRKWAKDAAEYDGLGRLCESEDTPKSIAELLKILRSDDTLHFTLEESFDLADIDNPSFCKGFVKGALAVFSEVFASAL